MASSPVRFEVDHKKPLWNGGRDDLTNTQVLCRDCHQSKTRVEAGIRAARKRTRARTGRTWAIPRLPLWQLVGAVCLLAGAIDGRWRLHALLVFATFAWWEWQRRGEGIDRIRTREARAEGDAYQGRFLGFVAGLRDRTFTAYGNLRWGLMGASACYLAGYWLPRYLL